MPRERRPTGHDGDAPGRLFVDSGAWIALFSSRDGRHADADRIFRQAVARGLPLITTNLVLAEVHRWLLFHGGIRPAATALTRVEASPRVTIEFATREHHRDARQWIDRLADQRISYTDAVSFAVMQATRCTTALAFDHDFILAGFSLWRG